MSGELANTGKILIYQNEKGDTKIDVYFEEDTIWMAQRAMCELYQVAKSSVSEHIAHIFEDGELEPQATVRKFRTVQMEGSRPVERTRDYSNLDMILAVGYRVRSNVGIHFRRWASGDLTEYMKKGFVLNDERLRNPGEFGADYFDELLERIRDIRASEKRVYQKVKEIFALSVDYDSKSRTAQDFFKSVQNKLEYAATGHTAPEIIATRADASKDNMGLNAFEGAKVRRKDVTVAKNYMTHEEISTLNLIVNMYGTPRSTASGERSSQFAAAHGGAGGQDLRSNNETPALNALKALCGAPISMGRGEIPVGRRQRPSGLPFHI